MDLCERILKGVRAKFKDVGIRRAFLKEDVEKELEVEEDKSSLVSSTDHDEKEYLGSKGNDEFYYLSTALDDEGKITKARMLNALGTLLLERDTPESIAQFIIDGVNQEGVTVVSVNMVMKYFMHEEEKEKETILDEPAEEMVPADEVPLKKPGVSTSVSGEDIEEVV